MPSSALIDDNPAASPAGGGYPRPRRQAVSRAAWLAALAALLLFALGLVVEHAPGRHRLVPGPLAQLHDGHWAVSGKTVRAGGENVQLRARGVQRFDTLLRYLPVPARATHLHLRLQVRASGLGRALPGWPPAGVQVRSLNSRGERLWYWPERILDLPAGDSGWQERRAYLPLSPAATQLLVMVHLLSDAGRLEIGRFEVHAARERAWVSVLRHAVLAGWLLLGAGVALRLLHGPRRRWQRAGVLGLAAMLVAAGVVPHPYLGMTLQWGRDTLLALPGYLPGRADSAPPRSGAGSDAGASTERSGTPGADRGATAQPDGTARSSDRPPPRAPASAAGEAPDAGSRDGRKAASAASVARSRPVPEHLDGQQVGHALAFAVLTLASLIGWPGVGPGTRIALLVLLSVSIQAVQTVLVTRSASLADSAHDMAGIAAALLAAATVRAWRRRRPRTGRAS